MIDFKIGDAVVHLLSNREMIVLCVSSDNMVDCRYLDNNGIFCSQTFYPEEIRKAEASNNGRTGFNVKIGKIEWVEPGRENG